MGEKCNKACLDLYSHISKENAEIFDIIVQMINNKKSSRGKGVII